MVLQSLRAAALALALLAPAALLAQADGEARIKAAYLYRFAGFVQWPEAAFAGPGTPFVIGVIASDELAAALEEALSSRTVQNRKVEVRRVRPGAAPEPVHILFIGDAENARIGEIAAAVAGKPVLVVTESESATTRGSMINFVTADDKVRFDVALAAAEKGNLKISARLLTVARKVLGPT